MNSTTMSLSFRRWMAAFLALVVLLTMLPGFLPASVVAQDNANQETSGGFRVATVIDDSGTSWSLSGPAQIIEGETGTYRLSRVRGTGNNVGGGVEIGLRRDERLEEPSLGVLAAGSIECPAVDICTETGGTLVGDDIITYTPDSNTGAGWELSISAVEDDMSDDSETIGIGFNPAGAVSFAEWDENLFFAVTIRDPEEVTVITSTSTTSTIPTAALFQSSVNSLDFGEVKTGNSLTRGLTLTNAGTRMGVLVSAESIDTRVALETTGCRDTLLPALITPTTTPTSTTPTPTPSTTMPVPTGDSCELRVKYAPSVVGDNLDGKLRITYNDGLTNRFLDVTVTGTAVADQPTYVVLKY